MYCIFVYLEMLNRISHLKKLKLFRKFQTISYYDRNEILAAPFLSNIFFLLFVSLHNTGRYAIKN